MGTKAVVALAFFAGIAVAAPTLGPSST